MKRAILVLTFLFFGITVFSQDTLQPNAKSVWKYISSHNYKSWELFPGTTKMYKGKSPHGAYINAYLNEVGIKSIKNKQFADGTMIVKENFTPKKKLAAITVMFKHNDFNKDAGDWFWAKYTPKGVAKASGKVSPCIRCHTASKDYDWSNLKANLAK